MTARGDLIELIQRELVQHGYAPPTALADAILAAGWRPPTLIDTQRDDGCPQCVAIRSSATA